MDSSSSFSSLRAYLNALSHTPTRLAQRALSVSTSYDEMSQVRSRSGTSMRKTLRWFDLVGLGIGGMVGAGVFVTTGHATRYAGPAVLLSYAIAGFCALLSAFCYTEFAVDMPVAGGAFSYLRVTFGEFAAFLTGANLVADYVLSNAAVARGLTVYLGTTIGISSAKWRLTVPSFPKGFNEIDIVAVAVVLVITLVICYRLLPHAINAEAPFSAAFSGRSDAWGWISGVIGVGASFGILTSLLVAMLGQARYMCVIGRSNVVPSWFARVHPKTSTPVNASAFLGIFTAAIALFTDLDVLLNLVSIGTLFVFYMVANAVIYRRYVATGTTNPWPTLSFLCSFSITAIMFTLIWKFVPTGGAKAGMLSVSGVIAIAILQLFHCMVPQVRKPEFWGVPFMPWIPSISIFLNVFLLGSLDGPSYVRFGFFSAVAVLFYVFYSVHASFDAAGDGSLTAIKNGEIHVESKEIEDQISFKV
uniref:Cationic amino acid transporter C-terminal domain-containing protein n=1 Tax=Glycine max TaxID=3847 RepID=A0A0R0IAD8_SOYBN